jgi:hypothetical protein
VSDLGELTRLVVMECMIIRLTEEETWSWRKGDRESEELKKEVCAAASLISQKLLVRVDIESIPEDDPNYMEQRPTILWSSDRR